MNINKSIWKVILQESIEAIKDEVDNDMPLSGIQLMMVIPEKGRISFREIEKLTGLPHSTCSRGLALLAGMSRIRDVNTIKLIEFSDDAVDRRVRYASFTVDGLKIMDKIFGKVAQRLARLQQATETI